MTIKKLTNRDRFLYGDVFLTANMREMYFEPRTGSVGAIMIDGRYHSSIKLINKTCFVLILITVGKKEITEVVEFDKLNFVA
ncbi:MAG TPA: hypothetical protein VGC65_00385 [Bacteroidia bacterium]|jgi:hypothetical protein